MAEAVKALPEKLTAHAPELPWTQIAGMRNQLAHRYFDTSMVVLTATVDNDLPELEQTVTLLMDLAQD